MKPKRRFKSKSKKISCIYCKSFNIVKYGKSNQNKQRYKCKKCNSFFVEKQERKHYPDNIKKEAINLYLKGYGIGRISKKMKIPTSTIRTWIKPYK